MNKLIDSMIQIKQISESDASAFLLNIDGNDSSYTEENVLKWLADEYDLSYSELLNIEPDKELLSLFPARVLLKHELLPIRRINKSVEIATSRLFATEGMDTLKSLTGLKLIPILTPSESVRREMKKHLGVGADTLDSLEEEDSFQIIDENPDDDLNLDEAAEDASIIRFVNQVMSEAISTRATDIHFEPFEDELRIRYRIDGVLHDVPVPSQIKKYQAAIVSRVKILSHLDIAEKRLPQDGRIKVSISGSEVDVRVSIIPMLYGEGVVMRLLPQDSTLRGMAELNMDEREEKFIRSLLDLPHGIILVTGPTGSGKTTTLYSALNEINDSVRKIITIEDPVEYHIKGINQIQVSEKAGLTFSKGLRSILRHDPDVILIGEIRDSETAQIAIQSSLTGHLVFSTLHTNDAPGALTRLVDMGVEPYLVASALESVIAQRLVRVLCTCKKEYNTPAASAIKEKMNFSPETRLFQAVGCNECLNTGFLGRRGIFELMAMNDEIREMILKSHSTGKIREAARKNGLKSLSEDGWRLIREGATTMEEVLRVTKDERLNANV
jgi:type II secretion system protein E